MTPAVEISGLRKRYRRVEALRGIAAELGLSDVQVSNLAVASDGGVPVLLYNIPSRTGRLIEVDTLARLGENPGIVAVKDAGPAADLLQPAALLGHGTGGVPFRRHRGHGQSEHCCGGA